MPPPTENACAMNGVREPERGVVFSTNHYFSEEMQTVSWQWDPRFISTRYFQNSVEPDRAPVRPFRKRSKNPYASGNAGGPDG